MMKRYIAMALSLVLALSLCAPGISAAANEAAVEETGSVVESVEPTAPAEPAAPESDTPAPEDTTVPEVQPETPEVKPENPEVQPENPEVTPENPEVQPENPEVKPENPEVKPETPEVQPENPEVQPETPEVQPETPEVQPEVPEAPLPEKTTQDYFNDLMAATTTTQVAAAKTAIGDEAAFDAFLAELTDEQRVALAAHLDEVSVANQTLYQSLMDCMTYDEMNEMMEALTSEDLESLTSEQIQEVVYKYDMLDLENRGLDENGDPLESEVIVPVDNGIVDMTDVAPFLDPVQGAEEATADEPPTFFNLLAAPAEKPVDAVTYAAPTAVNAPVPQVEHKAAEKDNGVTVNKTAVKKPGENDLYTITLEAYATGDKIITETTEEVPTDIVLVLDQSGSMTDEMETTTWKQYTGRDIRNENLYKHRLNGGDEKMYFLAENGQYYQVSVDKKTETIGGTPDGPGTDVTKDVYEKCKTFVGTNRSNAWYYGESNNLWAKKNGKYEQVTVTKTGNEYTYKLPDETTIATSQKDFKAPTFTNVDEDALFQKKTITEHIPGEQGKPGKEVITYTYYYTVNGIKNEIGKSEGNTTEFTTPLWHEVPAGTITRIDALTKALNNFTDSVKTKAMGPDGKVGGGDDINHRIAVVGFAGGKNSSSAYKNSELFVGADQYNYEYLGMKESASGKTGKKHEGQFQKAFQNMNETTGQGNVAASIGALQAEGATNTHYGMEMAKKVLDQNPIKNGEKRNRVVIVFTDGAPNYKNGFILDVANSAIDYSTAIKGTGATVYGVGIFNGADGTDAGKKPKGDLDTDKFPESGSTTDGKNACNWFMQNLSSNNGTPKKPSYYLSASNAGALNNIFEQIAGQIESGGSTSTLTEQAVIKDIVAPQFELPAGTKASDIHLHTYQCTGKDKDGNYTWKLDDSKLGNSKASLSTGTDDATGETVNKVDITGFDYSKNYVGTVTDEKGNVTYRGHKLVITFDVRAKDAFFGGNHVNTNTKAELFEKPDAKKPVEVFPVPNVDVPLKPITVTVPDGYVYLGGSVNQAELNKGLEVYVGNNKLDMTKGEAGHWGLQAWQVEGVKITTPDALTGFQNMTADKDLTVDVTITPVKEGSVKANSNRDTGHIGVIKPVITWQDSQINLGETANYETQNFVEVKWMYGTTPDSALTDKILDSRGTTAPTLTYAYDPAAGAFKVDTPVKVTVTVPKHDGTAMDVTENVTFLHKDCNFKGCKWGTASEFENPAAQFIVHIKSFNLTITKVIEGTKNSNGDSFLFTITSDNGYKNTVVINGAGSVTIKDLPSGTYTVTEDTSWSWTYTIQGEKSQTVSPDKITGGTANVTFTNKADTNIPLSDETHVDNRWADKQIHKSLAAQPARSKKH